MFHRNVLPPTSGRLNQDHVDDKVIPPNYFSIQLNQTVTLKLEAACTSETSIKPLIHSFITPKNDHHLNKTHHKTCKSQSKYLIQ